jgi:hypothetical protein
MDDDIARFYSMVTNDEIRSFYQLGSEIDYEAGELSTHDGEPSWCQRMMPTKIFFLSFFSSQNDLTDTSLHNTDCD